MSELSERLAVIRERAKRATEGPWGHWPEAGEIEIITSTEPGGNEPRRGMEIIASSVRPKDGWDAIYGRDERHVYRNGEPDAEFIAHARTDVPQLVAALEAVSGIADEWDRIANACPEGCCGAPESAYLRDAIIAALDVTA